ncbi:MAG TPA: PqiC family protein [Acetobacteraceae bacterium]|jgi:uncharacterized protein|nr:PqiC family protein [Acetobacteraceae bacterium]
MRRLSQYFAWRAIAVLAALSGCSSANPTLYTIAPINGAEQYTAPKVIVLRQLGMERYLERLQIVRSSENYRLVVMENDWWGEPLSAMLTRVLVTELGQRLPQSTVISEAGAVSAAADATVTLNVLRLDEGASGLILQAQAGVTFKRHAAPVLRDFRISVPLSAPGTLGEVAATSIAVGRLADGLVAMLVAGPSGP